MVANTIRIAVGVFLFGVLTGLYARQTQTATPVATVPRVVRINGTFRPSSGLPAAPVESVTFSIYKDETDRTPLWQETQNVTLDAEGRYSVLMGSSFADGMPLDLCRRTTVAGRAVQPSR